jgi:hypothetical protein
LTRIFLEKGGDINQIIRNKHGNSETLLLLTEEDPEFGLFLIKECGASMDMKDSYGDNLLDLYLRKRRNTLVSNMDAFYENKVKFIRYLIDHTRYIDGQSLLYAIRYWHNFPITIVKPILDRGVDPEYKGTDGKDAIDVANAIRTFGSNFHKTKWKNEILDMLRVSILKKHRKLDLNKKKLQQLKTGVLTNRPEKLNQQQLQKMILRHAINSTHGMKQDMFKQMMQFIKKDQKPQKISYFLGQNQQDDD